MTAKLARATEILAAVEATQGWPQQESVEMVEQSCPWCEETLLVEPQATEAEQRCPVCLTSWSYVEEAPMELAAAA